VIVGNSSDEFGGGIDMSGGGSGFGLMGAGVVNCLISGNAGQNYGGGVYCDDGGTLYNCAIVNNITTNIGAGVYCSQNGTLVNCIIYSNTVDNWANNAAESITYTNCCTWPTNSLPGTGNITNNPQFIDWPAGNCRLALGSPCIDAGANQAWMSNATDLDGRPRIRPPGGTVDIGAYEFFPQGTIFSFR